MSDNLVILVSDSARLMRRSFDERARTINITRPRWRAMAMLSRHEGINQGALAELLEVEPMTLCRMVDRMQDAGLVERRADPSDRRAWQLFLTKKATPLMDQLRVMADGLMGEATQGLTAEEQQQLSVLLTKVRTNLSPRNSNLNEKQSADG